jgi:hypothetical protein
MPPRAQHCACGVGSHAARIPMRYVWRSGRTGTISRPKVKLVTPANEAYHAASAVASPNQPLSLLIPC